MLTSKGIAGVPRARGAGPREGQDWTPVSKSRKQPVSRPAKKPTSNVEA